MKKKICCHRTNSLTLKITVTIINKSNSHSYIVNVILRYNCGNHNLHMISKFYTTIIQCMSIQLLVREGEWKNPSQYTRNYCYDVMKYGRLILFPCMMFSRSMGHSSKNSQQSCGSFRSSNSNTQYVKDARFGFMIPP